ncbi:MAG TPA: choice-of-anchor D domain-containing protein, partial [Terracidiphilus sp.]|nr:choice-of-anchor D domain-containing protein [Terracidiphilus sp.]
MRALSGLVSVLLFALASAACANAATVSPASLSWAAVATGNRGGQKVVTLTNSSATAINIAGISFSGANPADFIIYSKTCGATLAAGASCTANIVFGPTATGTRTAILNFSDSDTNSPQTVTLSGLGTSGVVAASPSSIAFASTAVGSSTAPQTVMLTNGNTSPITVSSVAVTGANASDFVVSGNTCGASLSVNASCAATLVFKPSAAGTRTANLTFTDSAASSPQAVALSGIGGVAPVTASASPTSLSFTGTAVGASSAAQTVTLSNGPASPITISSIAVSGDNASDFVLSSTTCGSSMAISATCTATIIFRPSATGARAATL